jgi:predicted acylesterase/phospholipase RssA
LPDPQAAAGIFHNRIQETTMKQAASRPESYTKKVALVLQGGGALGSYQAGVYEALASSDYKPDWVAGISIGAINMRHRSRD